MMSTCQRHTSPQPAPRLRMLPLTPSLEPHSQQRGLFWGFLCVPCVCVSPFLPCVPCYRIDVCGPACLLRVDSLWWPLVSVAATHRVLLGFLSGRPSAGAGHRSRPVARGGSQELSTGTCGSGKSQSQISAWSVERRGMSRLVQAHSAPATPGRLCLLKFAPRQSDGCPSPGATGGMEADPCNPLSKSSPRV